MQIHPKVHGIISENIGKSHFYLACSGGVDSVALLHFAIEIFKFPKDALSIIHFNHKIRPESDLDEKHVRSLAQLYGYPFIAKAHSGEPLQSEEDARNARITFFNEITSSEDYIPYILQAHHLNDALENMLMKLTRGSGLSGLVSPKPISSFRNYTVLRPLIYTTKEQILDYAENSNLKWLTDQTNQTNRYFRNRIRNKVVPTLKQQLDPDRCLETSFQNTFQQLADDSDLLESLAFETYQGLKEDDSHKLVIPDEVHPSILRRIIHIWSLDRGINPPLDAKKLQVILNALKNRTHAQINLSENSTLRIEKNQLSITTTETYLKPWSSIQLHTHESSVTQLENGLKIGLEIVDNTKQVFEKIKQSDANHEAWIEWDKESPKPIQIRRREEGDSYRPLGSSGKKTIKDCMINRKIPKHLRYEVPVFLDHDGEIVWVPGLLPSENFKIRRESKIAMRLTIKPNLRYWNILPRESSEPNSEQSK